MPHTPIPEDLLRQQIGQRIADLRDLRGMSRIEFYERLGIERKLRFKPERDQNFTAAQIIRICDILTVPWKVVFDGIAGTPSMLLPPELSKLDSDVLVKAGELIRGKGRALPKIRRTQPQDPIATYLGGVR
ncbi:MAG: hypothetical protein AAF753_11600 [Pseudomonadota bacterium]